MDNQKKISITDFRIESPKGDGINIRNFSGSTEISNGSITGAGGHGIVIGGPAAEPQLLPDEILKLVKALDQSDLDELRKLLANSTSASGKETVVATSSLGEILYQRGIRVVDVIDKITSIITKLN